MKLHCAKAELPFVKLEPMLHSLGYVVPPPQRKVGNEHACCEGARLLVHLRAVEGAVSQINKSSIMGSTPYGGSYTVLREGPIVAGSDVGRKELPDITLHDYVTVEVHESSPQLGEEIGDVRLDVLQSTRYVARQSSQCVQLVRHLVQLGCFYPHPTKVISPV